MTTEPIAAALRTLRKKSGLTQRELAYILGFKSEFPVSRHERSIGVPNLLTAIAYEIIFRTPISVQFRGLYKSVEASIEQRLGELEEELQQSTAKGRGAIVVARKLEFCCERNNPEPNQPIHETLDL